MNHPRLGVRLLAGLPRLASSDHAAAMVEQLAAGDDRLRQLRDRRCLCRLRADRQPELHRRPDAPDPAQGSSDGQPATTAFVTNAVADSVVGVACSAPARAPLSARSADITRRWRRGSRLADLHRLALCADGGAGHQHDAAPPPRNSFRRRRWASSPGCRASMPGPRGGLDHFRHSGAGGALLASTVASLTGALARSI